MRGEYKRAVRWSAESWSPLTLRNSLIRSYSFQAKKAGRSFLLTQDQCEVLFQGKCFYCGTMPSTIWAVKRFRGKYIYNGIDRLDSGQGYTIDNVVSCCKICNIAKGSMPVDDFIRQIKKIWGHRYA